MNFKNIDFPLTLKISSTGDMIPLEFFGEVIPLSKKIQFKLGYFSSNSISTLSYGFAQFIYNGGTIDFLINHFLSEGDYKLLNNDIVLDEGFYNSIETNIIRDLERLNDVLTKKQVDHFYNCLRYLIDNNRVTITPVTTKSGEISHYKEALFWDFEGNIINIVGSCNFTYKGIVCNGESFIINRSWGEAAEKANIQHELKEYEKIFNKESKEFVYLQADKLINIIKDKSVSLSAKQLLEEELNLVDINSETYTQEEIKIKKVNNKLKEKFEKTVVEIISKPKFPFGKPRDYQTKAYQNWVDNNKCGLFAMATGTGKTLTALNCILNEYISNNFYKVIIVVPTKALVKQWEEEVKAFNFENIISTHSNKEWKNSLQRYVTRSILDRNKNIILITTYSTFNRDGVQNFIKSVKGIESFIYVADEAHNIGSPKTLKNLPLGINNRIGLSATPDRIYDEIGSKMLYNFFNSHPPKYTFRYTMKEAIDAGVLCKYDYFPIFIDLTSIEMREYNEITRELRKFIDPEIGKYTEEAQMKLLQRKRVIHKAFNKKNALVNLLDELQQKKKLDYTFVFVPEGYEPDYSEIDDYEIDKDDAHIIDEYAEIFKNRKYSFYKYLGGIEDSDEVLKNFANGDIQVLLSMKCLDEGVDIPRAEHAIFCSSTGNPRQFVQRRGRVLRKSKGKEKAYIWDMIVTPPISSGDSLNTERNLFLSEVKRIVNFAALADNQIEILYGPLKQLCEQLGVNLFDLLEQEIEYYK